MGVLVYELGGLDVGTTVFGFENIFWIVDYKHRKIKI